ncbi:MAG: choline/carnitine O-acyltransferase, partial [Ornithinimicrobium sp.]
PRGQAVCGVQREVLAGGVRHPLEDVDVVRAAAPDPAHREIGLLLNDRFFVAPISDERGRPLPAAALERFIAAAVEAESSMEDSATPGFTALSSLGSETASAHLDRLMQDPANAQVYDRLTQALFVVNLIDEAAQDQEHLRRTAFLPGQAWAYTSITYQVGLADDFTGMHLEHSRIDAATLKAVLAVAQEETSAEDRHPDVEDGAPIEHLQWHLSDELASDLTREITAYREQAEQLQLDTVRLPRPVPADLPFRISDDALCQWTMLYAQLATYGTVRSTYEAVDMRHYQAGRTECLRSNTPEAVALVAALITAEASAEQVHAAAHAHKEWIKACKTGHGIDRHLTGLALMAEQTGRTLPVQQDAGWDRLKTDFLSTTSIGDHDHIAGMAFAPTSGGGIGINYTPLGDDYEFLVISHRRETTDIEAFLAHLADGTQALSEVLAGMVEE